MSCFRCCDWLMYLLMFFLKGHLRSHAEIRFSVYYLPGTPEFFQETFHLQLAFNETENITIRGEGIFPRVYLDLPRDLSKCSFLYQYQSSDSFYAVCTQMIC